MESRTLLNPIGVKGADKGGTISAPAAIATAVEDALRPFGARITETPITLSRIIALIKAGETETKAGEG